MFNMQRYPSLSWTHPIPDFGTGKGRAEQVGRVGPCGEAFLEWSRRVKRINIPPPTLPPPLTRNLSRQDSDQGWVPFKSQLSSYFQLRFVPNNLPWGPPSATSCQTCRRRRRPAWPDLRFFQKSEARPPPFHLSVLQRADQPATGSPVAVWAPRATSALTECPSEIPGPRGVQCVHNGQHASGPPQLEGA